MKKDYLFRVKTTEYIGGSLGEGSVIYVKKEMKNHYQGIWSSMWGTCRVKVPKHKCIKLDDLDKLE